MPVVQIVEGRTCKQCIHATGLRVKNTEPFSYYCCWLQSELPPPLIESIEEAIGAKPSAFSACCIEDVEDAEWCPRFEAREPKVATEEPNQC